MDLRGFGAAPPAAPPLPALMPGRLINTLMNLFAREFTTANNGKSVYMLGEGSIVPITGGFPMWVYTEFNALGGYKTARARIPMPEAFTLLGYFGSASVNTVGGYRMNIYDVNRRIRLTDRPPNFQLIAGTGSAPLFQGAAIGSRQAQPYQFQVDDAQVLVTCVNLESSSNNIQLGMYGVQGGKSQ
jgi:hypothetical protein